MIRRSATAITGRVLICVVVVLASSAGATEDSLNAVEDLLTAVEMAIAAQFSVV